MTALSAAATCRKQAALRIQQEHTGRDDLLPLFKPCADLNAIG